MRRELLCVLVGVVADVLHRGVVLLALALVHGDEVVEGAVRLVPQAGIGRATPQDASHVTDVAHAGLASPGRGLPALRLGILMKSSPCQEAQHA